MEEAFNLENPEGVRKLLSRARSSDRESGKQLYNRGAVIGIVPLDQGSSFSIKLADRGRDFAVRLYGEADGSWQANCECDKESQCAHVCAAVLALLAEHRTATVRNLSSSLANALGQAAAPSLPKNTSLEQSLIAALGRPLAYEEKRFLTNLRKLFLSNAGRSTLPRWELEKLGLNVRGEAWGFLSLWPSYPKNEHEFWLYIACALREEGTEIPEFMLPVSDTAAIEVRIKKWRRGKEIQRWENAFSNRPLDAVPHLTQVPETDVRLVLDENEMRLEISSPDGHGFQPLKVTRMRQMVEQQWSALTRFAAEGELLWQLFSVQGMYAVSPRMSYDHPEAVRILNRLLRVRTLETRICDISGQPVRRIEQPLRWKLDEALDRESDYTLSLVQADGTIAPEFVAVLPGSPTLYLSRNELFAGPDPAEEVLESLNCNRIPAPAVESAAGIAFLDQLGVALPDRLRQRIRKLPFQVAITCELKQGWFDPEAEDCHFEVLAEAADGCQQSWTGGAWLQMSPRAKRKTPDVDGKITVYDTSSLLRVPALFEPLSVKSAGWGESGLVMRVTKKFPELFSSWVKSLPGDIRLQLKGDLNSFLEADVAGRVTLDASEVGIDWFDLRVVLDIGDTALTQEEIKMLLNAKGKFVRLKGKGWKRLHYDLTEDENEKLARLGLSARELSAEPQRLHALQLADASAKRFLPAEQAERIRRRADEIKARVAPDLPLAVKAQLRPYQQEGFHFLAYLSANRFGGILADDMGLGKTLQTLSWLLWVRQRRLVAGNGQRQEKQPGLPSLVVCPKSVMDNWRAEAERFTPSLRVKLWHANEVRRLHLELNSADLHVLNYSQLRNINEALLGVRWLAVILDEGQYIKNPNSQTAQVARTLQSEHRLILSGTPIENRLMDLWSLMAFAMPGVLGNRAQFARLYDAKGDPFARKRLAARVRPFLLRRTKAQVAGDLPDRIEEDLFCELEGEQATLYRAELKRAQQLLLSIKNQRELAQQQFNFLTSLLRLRQICCHPRLINHESKAEGAKTEALLEQLEPLMEEGQKVLVFSQFVEMLNLLAPRIKEREWPLFYLSGQTEDRGELVRAFQESQGPGVFLISLKAGGFGLNLTAASYVVLFDPWWNPAVENQAIDRTHRIGQINKVIAYRLLIKNSVEEKIRELQKNKKALAEDVLGEEKFAQSLTMEDLRFLFSD